MNCEMTTFINQLDAVDNDVPIARKGIENTSPADKTLISHAKKGDHQHVPLTLIDPRDRSIRPGKRHAEKVDAKDTSDASAGVAVTVVMTEERCHTSLPCQTNCHRDCSPDQWLPPSDSVDHKSDKDKVAYEREERSYRVDEQRCVSRVTKVGVDGRGKVRAVATDVSSGFHRCETKPLTLR